MIYNRTNTFRLHKHWPPVFDIVVAYEAYIQTNFEMCVSFTNPIINHLIQKRDTFGLGDWALMAELSGEYSSEPQRVRYHYSRP